MPYKKIHQREEELGRHLTPQEHIDIVEEMLHDMRVRMYLIAALLILSIIGGGTSALYVYGKAQDKAIETTCEQANARWTRLRENLIKVALQRRAGETDKEYNARSVQTLALLDGLFDINCKDPSERVPVDPSNSSIKEEQG